MVWLSFNLTNSIAANIVTKSYFLITNERSEHHFQFQLALLVSLWAVVG